MTWRSQTEAENKKTQKPPQCGVAEMELQMKSLLGPVLLQLFQCSCFLSSSTKESYVAMSLHEKQLYTACLTWGPFLCFYNSQRLMLCLVAGCCAVASSWVLLQSFLLPSLNPSDVLKSRCLFQIIRPCHLTVFGKFYLLIFSQQKPVRQQKSKA